MKTEHEAAMRRLTISLVKTSVFLGWKQNRIAEHMAISRQLLSNLLHGSRRVSYEHITALGECVFLAFAECVVSKGMPTEEHAALSDRELLFMEGFCERLEWIGKETEATVTAIKDDIAHFLSELAVLMDALKAKGRLSNSEMQDFQEYGSILPRLAKDIEQMEPGLNLYAQSIEGLKASIEGQTTQKEIQPIRGMA